jgi:hypothetical protein
VLRKRASDFGFQNEKTFIENTLKALSIGNASVLMERRRRRAVKFLQRSDIQIKFNGRDRNACILTGLLNFKANTKNYQ